MTTQAISFDILIAKQWHTATAITSDLYYKISKNLKRSRDRKERSNKLAI